MCAYTCIKLEAPNKQGVWVGERGGTRSSRAVIILAPWAAQRGPAAGQDFLPFASVNSINGWVPPAEPTLIPARRLGTVQQGGES